jgi:hypothetical protein
MTAILEQITETRDNLLNKWFVDGDSLTKPREALELREKLRECAELARELESIEALS